MLSLLPRLASFDLPAGRNPNDLHRGDGTMVRRWMDGGEADCFAVVATGVGAMTTAEGLDSDTDDTVAGFAFVRIRPEMISDQPSCHLEVLVVASGAEGRGVGAALLAAAEKEARGRGAQSMTLHVFSSNRRAVQLYERLGFDGELIRMTKPLHRG